MNFVYLKNCVIKRKQRKKNKKTCQTKQMQIYKDKQSIFIFNYYIWQEILINEVINFLLLWRLFLYFVFNKPFTILNKIKLIFACSLCLLSLKRWNIIRFFFLFLMANDSIVWRKRNIDLFDNCFNLFELHHLTRMSNLIR